MTLTVKLMAGAGVLALSTGFAAAAPAVVENDLNLRAGPGIEFPVIAAMPTGATVDVMGCQASWCQVAYGGTTGWASRGYLGLGGGVAAGPAYGASVAYGGGYAPGYAYTEDTYGSYSPGYTSGYYGSTGYGGNYGYYGGARRFGETTGVATERRFNDQGAARGERRFSEQGSLRGERRGLRAETTGSARTEGQGAPEIKGNNPMRAEKNAAAVTNAQRPTEIQGNNPMKVGSGAAASEQRAPAQAGNARRNARRTTGAAPAQGGY